MRRPRTGRRARVVANILITALIVIAIGGVSYEHIEQRRDPGRLPRIGVAVDVGGRTLNIHCAGEGTPGVIFDAGFGDPGFVWSDIQAGVASLTRACWYDRAGEGWSDPGPFPRTSEASARDLHALVHTKGIPGPFVLVGHS